MTKWISFQNTMIEYELIYRRRKTMEIRIEPPGRVVLIVPLHTSDAMISTIMKKKEGWLREKLALMKRRVEQQVPHRFVCGEPFLYQGQLLRLELISTPSNQKSWVKREGERLIVAAPTPEPIPVRKAIEGWYRQQTLELVKDRILFYQPLIQRKPSQVQVKEQKRRWGSCSSAGKLMFNWRISMAPLEVLDYIVVHEMCHLIHMNHSKQFWQLVEKLLPDYPARKAWLKEQGWRLNDEFYICNGSKSRLCW